MRISTPSELHKNLASMLQEVIDGHDALIVHRGGPDEDVVIIPYAEWEARRITDMLTRTPEETLELMRRVVDMEAGRNVVDGETTRTEWAARGSNPEHSD